MARKTTWGTPSRTDHYAPLRPRFAFLRWGLILIGGIVALGALLLFLPGSLGLRRLVSPGSLSKGHADFESTCQNCHLTRGSIADRGVSNIRCERCHDAAAGGTLNLTAHLRMARVRTRPDDADPSPARFADVDCAACHVEHRGLTATLKVVNEQQCRRCHFSIGNHPDFYYVREKSEEKTGFVFNHKIHFEEKNLAVFKNMAKAANVPLAKPEDSCVLCHKPNDLNDDFFPIKYDIHCSSCHSIFARPPRGRLMEPVPKRFVTAPGDPTGPKVSAEQFQEDGGTIAKTIPFEDKPHPDEWVQFNIRRLGMELYPAEYEAERNRLVRQLDRLKRRLALLQPLAAQSDDDLRVQSAALESLIQYYESRLEKGQSAIEPGQGLDRLQTVLDTVMAVDPGLRVQVAELQGKIGALRNEKATAGLPTEDFETQRQQLLFWLNRLEELDPALKGRLDLYRRRVDALLPGESSREMLTRVRDQRARELQRLEDELDVRAEVGLYQPPVAERQRRETPFRLALDELEKRLDRLPPANPPGSPPAEEDAKKKALDGLQKACTYCHVFNSGIQERVLAALPVLKRAKFKHEPHLRLKKCEECHAGIQESAKAQELHLPSFQTCRECHNPSQGKQECRMCHLYHPLESP